MSMLKGVQTNEQNDILKDSVNKVFDTVGTENSSSITAACGSVDDTFFVARGKEAILAHTMMQASRSRGEEIHEALCQIAIAAFSFEIKEGVEENDRDKAN